LRNYDRNDDYLKKVERSRSRKKLEEVISSNRGFLHAMNERVRASSEAAEHKAKFETIQQKPKKEKRRDLNASLDPYDNYRNRVVPIENTNRFSLQPAPVEMLHRDGSALDL